MDSLDALKQLTDAWLRERDAHRARIEESLVGSSIVEREPQVGP